MGGEAHPSGVPHRLGNVKRGAAGVLDLAVDAEGQVVAARRADLGPHQHDHVAVSALQTVAARAERVVIGHEQQVCARIRRGADELGDRRRAVRVGRVHVHHARDVDGLLRHVACDAG
jgi:hypothetical protein